MWRPCNRVTLELCDLETVFVAVQRLELQRNQQEDGDTVRGQIVISLISRDRAGTGPAVQDAVGLLSAISRDPNELPEG